MAKTIKFNLICDNHPVRTIDDLRDNFSVEDLLTYYKNGLLSKWLEVRGYSKEYDKVLKIGIDKSDFEVIEKLVKIFEIETNKKKIDESLYIFQYEQERKDLYKIYDENNFRKSDIIDDYFTGYYQLIMSIKENPEDIAVIKSAINEMVTQYHKIFYANRCELFWTLESISPLFVMCLLMNEKARDYYIPYVTTEDGKLDTDGVQDEMKKQKLEMYGRINYMLIQADWISRLSEHIHVFKGATDQYWKDIEPKGKKCMIIDIDNYDRVRGSNNREEEYDRENVFKKFIILDGIDYKSNNSEHCVRYMEV